MKDLGIIGPLLMENAGAEISREMIKLIPVLEKISVTIVCGKGNNGGDGFVVARHLFNKGCSPHVILLAEKKELKGDAELNCRIADKMGIPITEVISQNEWEKVREVVIADISAPPFLFEDKALNMEMIEKDRLVSYFKKRGKNTHKGTYGHLFILAGSLGKTGAAVMAGKAALEMRAGLVTVGTPKSCLPIVARSMMELMTEPLEETTEWTLSEKALDKIKELLKGKNAVLIGPGISTHKQTSKLIRSLLPLIEVPVILDAVLASVYVHGLSGDMPVKKTGEKSLMAGDIIDFLPQAVLSMEQDKKDQ